MNVYSLKQRCFWLTLADCHSHSTQLTSVTKARTSVYCLLASISYRRYRLRHDMLCLLHAIHPNLSNVSLHAGVCWTWHATGAGSYILRLTDDQDWQAQAVACQQVSTLPCGGQDHDQPCPHVQGCPGCPAHNGLKGLHQLRV